MEGRLMSRLHSHIIRGGFGALLYQQVMSQYAYANTNASRPMLVLLAHDGDK